MSDDLEEALVHCASLYVSGDTEGGFTAFRGLRKRVDGYAPATPFAKKRIEVLIELDQVKTACAASPELFAALARAGLVDDQDALDELVQKRWNKGTAPGASALRDGSHLFVAYRASVELVSGKKRIEMAVLGAIALAALGAFELIQAFWSGFR
ncbi:MAG: hypothetical protein IPJ34_18595 [Myxococcales bacterium]|nr:hypothetical protein [Myxococcales bacterium]